MRVRVVLARGPPRLVGMFGQVNRETQTRWRAVRDDVGS